MNIHFTTLAQQEIQDAVDYYDELAVDLGSAFIGEIEDAAQLIVAFPEAWSKSGQKQRKFILNRFPYMFIYKIYPDHIVVSACAHQHRKPDYWFGRE